MAPKRFKPMVTTCLNTTKSDLSFELFDGIPEPVVLCDENLRIVTANRAAMELLDHNERIEGARASDILKGGPARGDGIGTFHTDRLEWRSKLQTRSGECRVEVIGTLLQGSRTGAAGWALRLNPINFLAPEFIGESGAVQELLEVVTRVAASGAASVLLEGESGTGKELIAKRIHSLSPRGHREFVAINCAAIPDALLESELFGYEKGAFTDACHLRQGLLEHAHRGTLFLDEIGDLPVRLQAKLLRVLEDHTFRRVGGTRDIVSDIRVVGATNADLKQAIQEKQFRCDLYYRLNAVQIRVPALREHPEDIPALAAHFAGEFARTYQKPVREIHPSALRLLRSYSWPGNVRELRNVMERAVLVERSPIITSGSLSIASLGERGGVTGAGAAESGPSALLSLPATEKELLLAALIRSSWNQARAAALLGIGRFALRYKMKKLGLNQC